MKTELKTSILKRIKSNNLKAFSCYDFTDLSSYKTISKCLQRLENEKVIERVIAGIYCLNSYDKVLKIKVLPSIDDVIHAIARKHNWIICPTGATALNAIGLSTQVAVAHTYLSNGPYKEYIIYDNKVNLKRTMNREIGGYSPITNLLIQCIKAIGEGNIEQNQIDYLRNKLSQEDKRTVVNETTLIQTWIRKTVLEICEH